MPAKAIHERGDWCGAWLAQPNTRGTACQIHGRLIHGNFAPESVPEAVLSAHHRREVPLPSGTVAQQYFHLAAAQPGRHLLKPAGLQVRQPPPALPWAEARSKRPASVSAHYCKLRSVSSTGSASFPHETINLSLRHPHHSFSCINLKYESTRLPPVLLLPESTLSPPSSAPYLRQRVTAILWSPLQAQAPRCPIAPRCTRQERSQASRKELPPAPRCLTPSAGSRHKSALPDGRWAF